MAIVKFISGDGVEHEVEETSMAADIMRQNGFQLVEEGSTIQEPEAEPVVVLSKLNRTDLIAEAAKRGIVIDPDDKAQTKRVIIEAIEEADSKVDNLPPASVDVYTEKDAIAQNDGVDVTAETKTEETA